MAKRPGKHLTLADKLETLRQALASGIEAKEAMRQAAVTPKQYGLAMFQAKSSRRPDLSVQRNSSRRAPG